jgi:hypothetical protein
MLVPGLLGRIETTSKANGLAVAEFGGAAGDCPRAVAQARRAAAAILGIKVVASAKIVRCRVDLRHLVKVRNPTIDAVEIAPIIGFPGVRRKLRRF